MLSFFRNNISDRLLALLALLLLLRVPTIIFNFHLTIPQLEGIIIGQKLTAGAYLYRDIYTEMAPLPAAIYYLACLISSQPAQILAIIALLLVIQQVLSFKNAAVAYGVFPERNFTSALLFVVLTSVFTDFFVFNPVLLATGFLIAALNGIFKHIKLGVNPDEIFIIGAYVGLATICYAPTAVFILLPLLAFVLYTGTTIRSYFLLLFGFSLVLLLSFLVFYIIGMGTDMYYNYFLGVFTVTPTIYIGYKSLVAIFSVPLLVCVGGVVLANTSRRFVNYQIICTVVMFIYLLLSICAIFLASNRAPYIYYLLIPPACFFSTHYFLLIQRKWLADVIFFAYLSAILFVLYQTAGPVKNVLVDTSNLFVTKTDFNTTYQRKKVLVLGNDLNCYYGNYLATPYINRSLASRHLDNLDNYQTVLEVYQNFMQDPPDIIVNADNTLKSLFSRMPALQRYYQADPNKKGIYIYKSASTTL